MWVDDYPRLLTETGRRGGSVVPLVFLFANGDDAPDFFGGRLIADWDRIRPALIALPADPARVADLYRHHMADTAASPRRADAIAVALGRMQAYVEAHYRAEADTGGTRIWRRVDALVSAHATASVEP